MVSGVIFILHGVALYIILYVMFHLFSIKWDITYFLLHSHVPKYEYKCIAKCWGFKVFTNIRDLVYGIRCYFILFILEQNII